MLAADNSDSEGSDSHDGTNPEQSPPVTSSPRHYGTPPLSSNHNSLLNKSLNDITEKPSHVLESLMENSVTPVRTTNLTPEADDKTPYGFRPGRLSQIEILERIFSFQKRSVLELVLQGCNGDLVKAIEHFLSAQDTLVAQHQGIQRLNSSMYLNSSRSTDSSIHSFHPYMSALNQQRPSINSYNKLASVNNNLKSAFTPLAPHHSSYSNIHIMMNPRNTSHSTDVLLNKLPPAMSNGLFSHCNNPIRTGDMTTTLPGMTHNPFGFGQLPLPLPLANSSFGFPHFLSPHRPFTMDTLPHSRMDKNSDRMDSDRTSDSWTESPGKDSKDSLE